MIQLKEVHHQEGNNYEAVKFKRVVINLFDNNGAASNNVFGKYYFNEYPELNNKTIVGIRFNSNGSNANDDFFAVSTYTDNNIGIDASYIPESVAKFLLVNLFNRDNELILQNFPLNLMNPTLSNVNSKQNGKITPLNTKLNLKNSYIQTTAALTSLVVKTAVSFTFYYLDK
jgi:hypothetical protein